MPNVSTLTIDGTTYTLAGSSGGGTVTSVAVSNDTNGGLSVSGSPITGAGTITVGHSNVLTSAQTTQAVYPIKIDKNGHISAYGSAVSIPTTASDVGAVPTTRTVNGKALSSDITLSASDVNALPSSTVIPTITDTYSGTSSDGMSGKAVKSAIDALDGSVTGTGGAGKTLTALSQTNGIVTATFGSISITKSQISDFPTNVSAFTNDAGYVTTDTKNTAGSTNTSSKIYLIGATEQSANPQTYSNSKLYFADGLYSFIEHSKTDQQSEIKQDYHSVEISGNDTLLNRKTNINIGTDKTSISGKSGSNSAVVEYISVNYNGNVVVTGLVTPTNDTDAATKKYVDDSISTIPTISLNGSSTTSAAFYAPTSAGTNGYFLKSNGSGAPTWASLPSSGVSDVTVGGTSVVSGGVAVIPAIPTVPTNVSAFTNDVGYVTTDEKLKTSAAGVSATIYYPVLTTDTTTAEAKKYSSVLQVRYKESEYDVFNLRIGNGVGVQGRLELANSGASGNFTELITSGTAARIITLPNATGTVALTSDIPTVPTNVSAFTNDAGYLTSAPVSDVTLNGTSVVSNSVAAVTASQATNWENGSGSNAVKQSSATSANGNYSVAEGYHTTSSGIYSHAGNHYTNAVTLAQTTFGEFNVLDTGGSTSTRGNYAVIVGNGTGTSARSNALNLTWDGDIYLALDTSAASGTVDGDLYSALSTAGWANSSDTGAVQVTP